jgi:hypothetical protein
MKANIAQVEDFCRYNNSNALKIVVNNEDYFDHPQIIGASGNFFSFFSYKLLTNKSGTALRQQLTWSFQLIWLKIFWKR